MQLAALVLELKLGGQIADAGMRRNNRSRRNHLGIERWPGRARAAESAARPPRWAAACDASRRGSACIVRRGRLGRAAALGAGSLGRRFAGRALGNLLGRLLRGRLTGDFLPRATVRADFFFATCAKLSFRGLLDPCAPRSSSPSSGWISLASCCLLRPFLRHVALPSTGELRFDPSARIVGPLPTKPVTSRPAAVTLIGALGGELPDRGGRAHQRCVRLCRSAVRYNYNYLVSPREPGWRAHRAETGRNRNAHETHYSAEVHAVAPTAVRGRCTAAPLHGRLRIRFDYDRVAGPTELTPGGDRTRPTFEPPADRWR